MSIEFYCTDNFFYYSPHKAYKIKYFSYGSMFNEKRVL